MRERVLQMQNAPAWWSLTDSYLVYGIAAVWHKHLE